MATSSDKPPPAPSPNSVKPETPGSATPRQTQPSPSADANVILVPSYSSWFSPDHIHHCEVRFLPEFFDSRSPSKNPSLYKYYRNTIVKHSRAVNPSRKLTFTEARKALVGDVGSVRRVFDFLEAWGLINYTPSALNKPLRWEDKDSKAAAAAAAAGAAESPSGGPKDSASAPNKESPKKRTCNGCKSLCSIACFVSEKYDMTLCARCYVRGNYQIGVSSSDFRRVEINEEMGNGWADKDTLHLLEGLMHYGDDWRKVAQHVGRSEKECVAHFLKIPFAEELNGDLDSGNLDHKPSSALQDNAGDAEFGMEGNGDGTTPSLGKRMRLTPLADASNPIMAQTAFLSALAGVKVAEAAACAAVTTLCEADYETSRMSAGFRASNARQHETDAALNGDTNTDANLDALGANFVDANSQLEKEGLDVGRALSGITGVQMKEIQGKIDRFEALDLQMEKEWEQLEQMRNMLFVDQMTLLIHQSSAPNTAERMQEKNVIID
ncbi:PREDICTED: SWI/SNF complex subunit SWI3B-like [Prunus mume]|uniref:SWI/SNF complex subunit SWI3B-like n=1 Tax=Prunus mume TaxID=102107 RepID=A0ABM1LLR1_PRUMU|nr:PREDICTED: SWI/SNF complex subunit SWI3B-like [Prunus mume]